MIPRFAVFLVSLCCAAALFAAAPEKPAPVLFILNSQYYDFMNPVQNETRTELNLRLVQELRRRYPNQPVSALFTFSGAYADNLWSRNATTHAADRIAAAAVQGMIEIGYNGENEPTYRNRPKADLRNAKTPQDRWMAYSKAAESFLRDAKDNLTGVPDPKRSGGLRRVQEIFGPVKWAAHFSPLFGGDAAYLHQLARLNTNAVLLGLTDPEPARGIVGYRGSLLKFGPELMAPLPNTSPELYWEEGYLRVSETSTADTRRFVTDEGAEALKTMLGNLNRSRVRVIQMEIGSYNRTFQTWHDGVIRFPPLTWAWDHPDEPTPPTGVPMWRHDYPEKEIAAEAAALEYLFHEFLPANPGSRVISMQDLRKMATNPAGTEVPAADIAEAARGMIREFSQGVYPPSWARSGDRFFSLAEMFQLLARSLAAEAETGKKPSAIQLNAAYGPLDLIGDVAPASPTPVDLKAVQGAARLLAPALADDSWRPVPANAVPAYVTVAGQKVNAAQFLRLMAEAYLSPAADARLPIASHQLFTSATFLHPKQVLPQDQGNSWTLKPAPLNLPAM